MKVLLSHLTSFLHFDVLWVQYEKKLYTTELVKLCMRGFCFDENCIIFFHHHVFLKRSIFIQRNIDKEKLNLWSKKWMFFEVSFAEFEDCTDNQTLVI